jgi:hypothetical protein
VARPRSVPRNSASGAGGQPAAAARLSSRRAQSPGAGATHLALRSGPRGTARRPDLQAQRRRTPTEPLLDQRQKERAAEQALQAPPVPEGDAGAWEQQPVGGEGGARWRMAKASASRPKKRQRVGLSGAASSFTEPCCCSASQRLFSRPHSAATPRTALAWLAAPRPKRASSVGREDAPHAELAIAGSGAARRAAGGG